MALFVDPRESTVLALSELLASLCPDDTKAIMSTAVPAVVEIMCFRGTARDPQPTPPMEPASWDWAFLLPTRADRMGEVGVSGAGTGGGERR